MKNSNPEQIKWSGYKFRAGKYGQQPFTKFLDGTKNDFAQILEVEVARICTKLEPVLENCISALPISANGKMKSTKTKRAPKKEKKK